MSADKRLFFFNDTATTEIYTLSLHDALPISGMIRRRGVIAWDGQEISNVSIEAIVCRGIAHVPQGRGTIADLSVDDNLRAGAYVRKDKEVATDMERWYQAYPGL